MAWCLLIFILICLLVTQTVTFPNEYFAKLNNVTMQLLFWLLSVAGAVSLLRTYILASEPRMMTNNRPYRHEISIEYEGKQYSGSYEINQKGGTISVFYAGMPKSAGIGGSPSNVEHIAKIVLRELVQRELKLEPGEQ
jgi:hypothetical protein